MNHLKKHHRAARRMKRRNLWIFHEYAYHPSNINLGLFPDRSMSFTLRPNAVAIIHNARQCGKSITNYNAFLRALSEGGRR